MLGKLLDALHAGVVCGASIVEEGHKDAQLGGGHVHTLPVVHPAGVGAPLHLLQQEGQEGKGVVRG